MGKFFLMIYFYCSFHIARFCTNPREVTLSVQQGINTVDEMFLTQEVHRCSRTSLWKDIQHVALQERTQQILGKRIDLA